MYPNYLSATYVSVTYFSPDLCVLRGEYVYFVRPLCPLREFDFLCASLVLCGETMFLRLQQYLAGRLAAFQVAMRLLCLFQFVDPADAQLEFSRADHVEHVAGTLFQLGARGDVMEQAWPRQEQRSFLRQLDG